MKEKDEEKNVKKKILSKNTVEFKRSSSFSNGENKNKGNRIMITPKIEENMYENIFKFRRSKSFSSRHLKPMPELKDDIYETMC